MRYHPPVKCAACESESMFIGLYEFKHGDWWCVDPAACNRRCYAPGGVASKERNWFDGP